MSQLNGFPIKESIYRRNYQKTMPTEDCPKISHSHSKFENRDLRKHKSSYKNSTDRQISQTTFV